MSFMPDNFDHIAQVVDVEGSLPTAPTLTLRLSAADLQRGGVISTADGTWRNLWIVETVSPAAGDGCMELTLKPYELINGD